MSLHNDVVCDGILCLYADLMQGARSDHCWAANQDLAPCAVSSLWQAPGSAPVYLQCRMWLHESTRMQPSFSPACIAIMPDNARLRMAYY